MKIFGSDTIKWILFVIRILKLIAEIFGDDEDKEQTLNHLSHL